MCCDQVVSLISFNKLNRLRLVSTSFQFLPQLEEGMWMSGSWPSSSKLFLMHLPSTVVIWLQCWEGDWDLLLLLFQVLVLWEENLLLLPFLVKRTMRCFLHVQASSRPVVTHQCIGCDKAALGTCISEKSHEKSVQRKKWQVYTFSCSLQRCSSDWSSGEVRSESSFQNSAPSS